MSFPTKQEILAKIANGVLCNQCKKNPATAVYSMCVWMVGPCVTCKEKNKQVAREVVKDNSLGSSRVHGVFEEPKTGAMIPVNEKGNVIRGEPKYTLRNGQKPIW